MPSLLVIPVTTPALRGYVYAVASVRAQRLRNST